MASLDIARDSCSSELYGRSRSGTVSSLTFCRSGLNVVVDTVKAEEGEGEREIDRGQKEHEARLESGARHESGGQEKRDADKAQPCGQQRASPSVPHVCKGTEGAGGDEAEELCGEIVGARAQDGPERHRGREKRGCERNNPDNASATCEL